MKEAKKGGDRSVLPPGLKEKDTIILKPPRFRSRDAERRDRDSDGDEISELEGKIKYVIIIMVTILSHSFTRENLYRFQNMKQILSMLLSRYQINARLMIGGKKIGTKKKDFCFNSVPTYTKYR